MKREIWITTNQQPWVEALAAGVITCKTRTSKPVVPLGATVLLHASKSRLWPDWKGLQYLLKRLPNPDPESWERGAIVAVGLVKEVGVSNMVMTMSEAEFWNVRLEFPGVTEIYNSVADWTVRFDKVLRLNKPVACRGFQAPFCHAKPELVKKVLAANPFFSPYFE